MAQDGKATTEKTTFSRTTSVSTTIHAMPEVVWQLLTNAADFTRWNSGIISLEGNIRLGEKIKLCSTLAPKRTFKLKITGMQDQKLLQWGDGQGTRVFTLTHTGSGALTFSMTEKIGGFMFPLYAKYIPSFDQSFEQFAADLKKEAERVSNAKN